jgi:hypothetical protein
MDHIDNVSLSESEMATNEYMSKGKVAVDEFFQGEAEKELVVLFLESSLAPVHPLAPIVEEVEGE